MRRRLALPKAASIFPPWLVCWRQSKALRLRRPSISLLHPQPPQRPFPRCLVMRIAARLSASASSASAAAHPFDCEDCCGSKCCLRVCVRPQVSGCRARSLSLTIDNGLCACTCRTVTAADGRSGSLRISLPAAYPPLLASRLSPRAWLSNHCWHLRLSDIPQHPHVAAAAAAAHVAVAVAAGATQAVSSRYIVAVSVLVVSITRWPDHGLAASGRPRARGACSL